MQFCMKAKSGMHGKIRTWVGMLGTLMLLVFMTHLLFFFAFSLSKVVSIQHYTVLVLDEWVYSFYGLIIYSCKGK